MYETRRKSYDKDGMALLSVSPCNDFETLVNATLWFSNGYYHILSDTPIVDVQTLRTCVFRSDPLSI